MVSRITAPRTLVYSDQERGFEPGIRYANPRYFSTVRQNINTVIVIGHWPDVVEAYKRAGVNVHVITPGTPLREFGEIPAPNFTPPAPQMAQVAKDDPLTDSGKPVDIPADWRDLPYIPRKADEQCLRALAASVSPTPIRNKAQAIAAIEAYLASKG